MRYIDAIKGSLIALIIFIVVAIYIPGKGPSNDVEIILTISTFLFAILAGFFIARLNNRFNAIRDLAATEDAHWLSFYKISQFCKNNFTKKIRELIDKYYISLYGFNAGESYKDSLKYFLQIYDELNKIKESNQIILSKLLDHLSYIELNRNKSSVLSLEKVKKSQWLVLIILSAIIIFSVFYLKLPEIYSQVIAVLLSTALILVLLMIRDLQNLKLSGEDIIIESGQEIFELIGKPRYYNQKYLKEGTTKIPKHVKTYRLGMHKPGERPNIKLIKN